METVHQIPVYLTGVNILHHYCLSVKWENHRWRIATTYSDFLRFPWCPFSSPGPKPCVTHYIFFSVRIAFLPICGDSFLGSFVLVDWQHSASVGNLVESPTLRICLLFSSWIDKGRGLWVGTTDLKCLPIKPYQGQARSQWHFSADVM